MTVSRVTLRCRYELAEARCECARPWHEHEGRCTRRLDWWGYGRLGPGGWATVPTHGPDAELLDEDDADRVQAVCWECVIQGLEAADGERAA